MVHRIGFRNTSPISYRAYNILLASLLLMLFSPVLIITAVALYGTQGPSIFYLGERLGYKMKPFKILKFRTLCSDRARAATINCTLRADANIETPLGKILRECRLDELPQLINVILGDMNICGPRPVRREIANIEASRIDGYAKRFEVRPGLIGPAQAYFGHGASKRLRARMNNLAVRTPVSIIAELRLFSGIAFAIFARVSNKIIRLLPLRQKTTQRKEIWLSQIDTESAILVESMDSIKITLDVDQNVDQALEGDWLLFIRLRSGGLRRARIRIKKTETPGGFLYEAIDEVGAFVIERYALGNVVVAPRIFMVDLDDDTRVLSQNCPDDRRTHRASARLIRTETYEEVAFRSAPVQPDSTA